MIDKKEILKKYWGYDSFRSRQEEIIDSVLHGDNIIALLPTGGGKSICYQVPALILPGACLVISPLKALIRDQIKHLANRGIKSLNLSEHSKTFDLQRVLDNAEFGAYKFIFTSPEKLQNSLIKNRLEALKISLIAIDEAHCISSWGHDFRTDFKKLGAIVKALPEAKVMALTATATPLILEDIKSVLGLEQGKTKLISSSLNRSNLAYTIAYSLNTLNELFKQIKYTKGLSIIYTGSRAKTKDLAIELSEKGLRAAAFHGGMSEEHKNQVLEAWEKDEIKVMVSTNAFGMGVDKSNVDLVIHYDLPPNMESYVQEVGRAGRAGQAAKGILFAEEQNIKKFSYRYIENALDLNEVKAYYLKLCQFLGIAYGELLEHKYPMRLEKFSQMYSFNQSKVYTGLKLMENLGILKLREQKSDKLKIQFKQNIEAIYSYLDTNNSFKPVLELLLRSYDGIFEEPTYIDTIKIMKRLSWNKAYLLNQLKKIEQLDLIFFDYENTDLSIQFLKPREDDYTINAVSAELEQQLKLKKQKSKDFLKFVKENQVCRNRMVLDYFDQHIDQDCGRCDVCLSSKKPKLEIDSILDYVSKNPNSSLDEICLNTKMETANVLQCLSRLLEMEKIIQSKDFTFAIKKNKS